MVQSHSAVMGKTTSSAADADDHQLPCHSAADAGTAVSQQLQEMSLNTKVLNIKTENCTSSDVLEDVYPLDGSHVQTWTSTGLVREQLDDIASRPLPSANVVDQFTSAGSDCHDISVGSISSQQLSVFPGSDMASVNHISCCESCLDGSELVSGLVEETTLFSCRECSVISRMHFAKDILYIVLHVVRHSEVDCSVFAQATLTVVQNEIYLMKVSKLLVILLHVNSALLQ